MDEIPAGSLVRLGMRFLTEIYRAIATSPHSFLYIAECKTMVIGFIGGSISTRRFYRWFAVRRGFVAAFFALPHLLSPGFIKRAVETLRYPQQDTPMSLPDSEILNFCVRSNTQGRGVGRRLFDALVGNFQQCDVSKIRIVTGENQNAAQHFYINIGAKKVGKLQVHEGIESTVFVYDVKESGV